MDFEQIKNNLLSAFAQLTALRVIVTSFVLMLMSTTHSITVIPVFVSSSPV